jgi:ABC-type nitrate/sulfonate/bicarbonate transport system substrate-binding protein
MRMIKTASTKTYSLLTIAVSAAICVVVVSRLHAADRVRVGLSALSLANSPLWVAEEKGFFKKYGIDCEIILVGGGASRSVSALLSGDLQFATTGGGAAISAALGGPDVVMIAAGNNKGVQRLMVRADIKTPEAVKGKRIGVTGLGSSGHLALLLMLKKWAIQPEEVQVLQVGASPIMVISLQKGGIDGAVLQDPSFFVAEDGGFKTLGDPAAMDIHYLQNVIVAMRSYLRTHRDLAGRFVKAFVEGIAYYKKNKDESVKILMKKMRIERGGEGYLLRSYQLYAAQYFDNVPYPSMLGVKTVLEFLVKDNPKAKSADPNSFVDPSFVKALDDNGFIKSLY